LVVSYSYDIQWARAASCRISSSKAGPSAESLLIKRSTFFVTDNTSGGAFGGGTGTGLLICRPLFNDTPGANNNGNQLPTSSGLPGCTPGTPTTVEQALVTGSQAGRWSTI